MAIALVVKMKKILIILSIFALNGGLSLYASTYDDILEKANQFLYKGKFLSEIDTLLKMRDLEKMTLNEYAKLTIWAAFRLQQIWKCRKAADEIQILFDLDLDKIKKKSHRLTRYTDALRIYALCGYNEYLKPVIDNYKYHIPYVSYANVLNDYGKSLENNLKVNVTHVEPAYYYARALGEMLSYKNPQRPFKIITNNTRFLDVNYQYELSDEIIDPIMKAYDNGSFNYECETTDCNIRKNEIIGYLRSINIEN